MTAFDYILLVLLIGSMLISLTRGLVKEVISLVSWIVAFYVAINYGEVLEPWLPHAISGDVLRVIVAFVVLFIGTRIVMMFLAKLASLMLRASGLTFMDRFLGALFGLAKGALIALALVLVCGMTRIPRQPFWRNAMFSPMAEAAARTVMPYLPGYFVEYIHY